MASYRWKNNIMTVDKILDSAWKRVASGGGILDEPHFVRELISPNTIDSLNKAALGFYPLSKKRVIFNGGFIHGLPLATFSSKSLYESNVKKCTRELADVVIVLNETAPGTNGLHNIIRRSACLIMFKKRGGKKPSTLRFSPGNKLPDGTDNEQFYLYNEWPPFSLQFSHQSAPIETFFIKKTISYPHNFSKFGALWDYKKNSRNWKSYWLYSNPTPSKRITESLGELIMNMVDNHPDAGENFSLTFNSTPPRNDWDGLMSTIYKFAVKHSWGGGRVRFVHPSIPLFLSSKEHYDCNVGTEMQFLLNNNHNIPHDDYWFRNIGSLPNRDIRNMIIDQLQASFSLSRLSATGINSNERITPVIWITSNNFTCKEYPYHRQS